MLACGLRPALAEKDINRKWILARMFANDTR
jgi:hypothetical protein